MTLDQSIIVWCFAVPVIIAATGVIAARWLDRFQAAGVAISWWLAVTVSMAARQGWNWWPEDAWRQAIWPLLGWVILAGTAPKFLQNSWFWAVAGLLACLTAMMAMPSGEAWSDTYHLHRVWMAAVISSCLINSFSLHAMAKNDSDRWCLLVALAGLGGPLVLAAATYASLAEWTLSIVAVTAVVAAIGIWPKPKSNVATVNPFFWTAFPVVAVSAGIAAAARFYSYEAYPVWVYIIALYSPAIIAGIVIAIDCIVSRSTWFRLAISVTTAVGLIAVCVWRVLLG